MVWTLREAQEAKRNDVNVGITIMGMDSIAASLGLEVNQLRKENKAFREALEYCGRPFEKRDIANKKLSQNCHVALSL